MNYSTLKTMIESLIKGYSCPVCNHSSISEQYIDIVWAAGNTVNIDMKCPSCAKHYMARMEVVGLDLSNQDKSASSQIHNMKVGIDSIKHALNQIKEKKENEVAQEIWEDSIKDEVIVDLSKDLKTKKLSASDLFDQ